MLKDQPVEYRGLHYESITMMTKRRPSDGERSLPDRAVPHGQPQWRRVYLDLTFGASLAGVAAPSASQARTGPRSEEHTSELQSRGHLVCRLLLEKKKTTYS